MDDAEAHVRTDEFERDYSNRKNTFTVKYRLPQFQILTENSIQRFYIDFQQYFKEDRGKSPEPTPENAKVSQQRPSRMTGLDMATPSADHI